MEVLWPGVDPARSAHALQVVLSDLRSALGNGSGTNGGRPFVCRTGDDYSLDVGAAGWVDAEAFEAEYDAGRRADAAGDADGTLRHLLVAESLYVGDFLADERFADWAEARRERMRDQYVDVLQRLLRHYEHAGQVNVAADYARKALASDPYLEPCYPAAPLARQPRTRRCGAPLPPGGTRERPLERQAVPRAVGYASVPSPPRLSTIRRSFSRARLKARV
jgi:DNA-binding SARP family transcriptional activator